MQSKKKLQWNVENTVMIIIKHVLIINQMPKLNFAIK